MPNIECTSTNVGPTLFSADVDGLKLLADAPAPHGGNAAMNPLQAQLATLANCVGITIAVACKNKGVNYEGMTVRATAVLDSEKHCLEHFKVDIHMPGEVTERCRRTVEAAEQMCAIGNLVCRSGSIAVSLDE